MVQQIIAYTILPFM